MLCKKCGYYAPVEAIICPQCGETLREGAADEYGAEAIRQGKRAREAVKNRPAQKQEEIRRRRRSGASHATIPMTPVRDTREEEAEAEDPRVVMESGIGEANVPSLTTPAAPTQNPDREPAAPGETELPLASEEAPETTASGADSRQPAATQPSQEQPGQENPEEDTDEDLEDYEIPVYDDTDEDIP